MDCVWIVSRLDCVDYMLTVCRRQSYPLNLVPPYLQYIVGNLKQSFESRPTISVADYLILFYPLSPLPRYSEFGNEVGVTNSTPYIYGDP